MRMRYALCLDAIAIVLHYGDIPMLTSMNVIIKDDPASAEIS